MKIGNRNISNTDKTFVIAEVGSNCKGDLILAKEHIGAAHNAGADAVKFQSLNMDKLYLNPSDNVKSLFKKIDLEESMHQDLKDYADEIGITFFSSPTYLDAVDLLDNIGIPLFKIASAQVGTFPRLVEKVAKIQKPTIFSTGLSDYERLAQTIKIFEKNKNKDYAILHCNSIYPTPYHKVFLDRMNLYKQMFDCPVGFSDHTDGIAVVLAAVALKANIIEKHFKLDGIKNTPDALFSIGFDRFSEMVSSIRAIEQACESSPRNSIEDLEREFLIDISYKLILKNTKKKGEKLSLDDFDYLRHSDGIDASLDEFIVENFCIVHDMSSGVVMNWSDLRGME